MSWGIERVIEPPSCGVPRASHQFPVVLVVEVVVVAVLVVVVLVVAVVVLFVGVEVVVDVGVDVVVDVLQDASSKAAASKKLRPNQIALFFTFSLHFHFLLYYS